MLINPELGLLTICSIMLCMAMINTEQWFIFQNMSFTAIHPVFISCLSLNSKNEVTKDQKITNLKVK